jgi:hypothetical protein
MYHEINLSWVLGLPLRPLINLVDFFTRLWKNPYSGDIFGAPVSRSPKIANTAVDIFAITGKGIGKSYKPSTQGNIPIDNCFFLVI